MSMPLTQELAERLKLHISENEDWIIKRILFYAKNQGYSAYLPTMEEAWRISVGRLNRPLIDTPSSYFDIPELHPHLDYFSDPYAQYGIGEARRHREMGISAMMFFSMFKYFRQTYDDLLAHCRFSAEETLLCRTFLKRYFDRSELGFLNEYMGHDAASAAMESAEAMKRIFTDKSLLLAVLESIERPIIAVDSDGNVLHLNLFASGIFGGGQRAGAYVYGKKARLPKELEKEIGDFLNSGVSAQQKKLVYDKRIYLAEMTRMNDIASKFGGAVIMLTDVTDRRQTETSLAESESFRTALMEGIAGAAVVINMETHTLEEYNKTAAEMFPYIITGNREKEAKFCDETGADPVDIFALAETVSGNEERLMEKSNGETIPLRILGIDVWYLSQRHKLLVMFDITREKMLERRLVYIQQLESLGEIAMDLPARVGRQTTDAYETLEKVRAALEECPNYCGNFVSGKLIPDVDKAQENIASLQDVMKALTSITQPDHMEKTIVDVNEVIRSCVLLTNDKWMPYASLELNLCQEHKKFKAYLGDIGQMLLNLLLNAAYAVRKKCEGTGEKGKIVISTRCSSDFLEIRISDTGIGIKKQDYKRIFDSGFTTKEIGRGTGHGLSLVHDIAVSKYKGTIEFKSAEDKGTEFTIRLPY